MFGWRTRDKSAKLPPPPPPAAAPDQPPVKAGLSPKLEAIRASRAEAGQLILPQRAAANLVAWMQSETLVEWVTVSELQAAWENYRELVHAWDIPFEIVREQVIALPGVLKIRRRIVNDPQFAAVRRRLIAQAKASAKLAQTNQTEQKFQYDDRPTLIYIPALPDDVPYAAGPAPKEARSARPRGGHDPAIAAGTSPAAPGKTSPYPHVQPMAVTARQLQEAA